MITIPNQLQKPEFRFIKINMKGKSAGKAALEQDWTTKNNYKYDDPKLLDWIKKGNNYGVICRNGGLIAIDADKKETGTIVEVNLHETFTIKTGNPDGKHYYYICQDIDKKIILDDPTEPDKEKQHMGEIQATGNFYVIGPGCNHYEKGGKPTGKKYEIIKDVPIATIKYKFIKDALGEYFPQTESKHWENKGGSKEIDITKVFDVNKLSHRSNEYFGSHPVHGSTGKTNFSINPQKGTWHCFRCNTGGGALSLIAVLEGIIDCSQARKGGLREDIFKKVVKVAKEKYKLEIKSFPKRKKGFTQEGKTIVKTSSLFHNNRLYEQVCDFETGKLSFLAWDSAAQKTIMEPFIETDDIQFIPINDSLLSTGGIILPTDAIDYGTFEDLLFEIECFIKTWLDISPDHLTRAKLYVLLTWLTNNLKTVPYLRTLGDYGTGKTRYLDVIGGICYKPMFVGGAVTSAPIFRIMDKWKGTLVLDEFTLDKSDEKQGIIQILNCGFQRGKPVLRCNKEGDFEVLAFDSFGAKIISTRQTFKDRALESRCITEIMQTTGRTDIPIELTDEFYKKRQELQNKLMMYKLKNWDKIKPDESISIDFGNILPRIKQALLPFTVLFQQDTEMLKEFINYAQTYNKEIIESNAESFDGQIFNAYISLLDEHDEAQQTLGDYQEPTITSTGVKNHLVNNGWKEDKLSTRTIGRHLKGLGFTTKVSRVEEKTVKKLKISDKKLKILRRKYVSE